VTVDRLWIWLPALELAALACGLLALVWLVLARLRRAGGWRKLAQVYATAAAAPAEVRPWQTVQVGRVIYRRCVNVGLTDTGLYLALTGPGRIMRQPALLIPWGAFAAAERATLYWRTAARLHIGQPTVGTVTVYGDLLSALRPWLSSRLPGLPEDGA
jgi:hypothetical protein